MKAANLSVLLLSQLCLAIGQQFTASISEMEYLLKTDRIINDDLADYIQREELRISHLKRSLNIYKKEHEVAMADVPNYLGHPVTAFKLINRLTTDLDTIVKGIHASADYIRSMSSLPDLSYPNEDDLTAAAAAVARVKSTHNYNVTDLAEWKRNSVGVPMSAGECYALGRALYNQQEYNDSLDWMHEALRKYKVDGDENIIETYILEFIAYTNYLLDKPSEAVKWTKRILELDPNHPRAPVDLDHYQTVIANAELEESNLDDYDNYQRLCRDEITVPRSVTKGLTCRYRTEGDPFLKLAPLKQEQLYRAPDVFLYHQVLSDREIAQIQDFARTKFEPASVIDLTRKGSYDNNSLVTSYRTGKTAFLGNNAFEEAPRLLQRIRDMTGLDLASSEDLQVVDYGVGGHYGPHNDAAITGTPPLEIISMTDVARGGETVFPNLGLSVPPARGSALHWTNLNPAGEGDFALLHASCPVVTGSKWILTKWMHEAGQELIKPCGLQYQPEGNWWKIPRPVLKTTI